MIYTITLNPAIDYIYEIKEEIVRGKNNKISKKNLDVGGKGTHVSIGLKKLNVESTCTGIIGEVNFEVFDTLIRPYSIMPDFYKLPNFAVRNNLIIRDGSKNGTILITEVGIQLTNKIIDGFYKEKLGLLSKEDIVVISGNPSNSTDKNVFIYLLDKLNLIGCKIILDISNTFFECANQIKIHLFKPNLYEFSEIVSQEADNALECIECYVKNRNKFGNVEILAISLGSKGSVVIANNKAIVFNPITLNSVNDTGAGDAYVAGFIYGLVNKLSFIECGKIATSVASSSTQEEFSSGFDVKLVNRYLDELSFKEVNI